MCLEQWRRTNLKTISIEDSTVDTVIGSIPKQVIKKYESLGIDISDLQTLSRNALAYFVRYPPTEEQIISISHASGGSKSLSAVVGVKA